jgi:uncharacterized membrane protein
MYSAHYHLLLNHWPILGTVIALGMLLVALVSKQDQLHQAGLGLFFIIALMAIPAYMSGNSAQQVLKDNPEVSMSLVQNHQGVALLGLMLMEFTGAFALIGLRRFSMARRPASWNVAVVLLLAILTTGLMTIAGNTGGEIRHPEISSGPAVDQDFESKVGDVGAKIVPVIQYYVTEYSMWVWPVLEDLHFIGLILIIGAIGVLNIRILGALKGLPLAPLQRFIPWGIAGFYINIITGLGFFIGMPDFYTNNPDFQIKMVVMVIAGANLMVFYCTSAFRPLALLGPGDDAPVSAKFIALSSLVLWIGLIVLGRYMPFFEAIQQ